MWFGSYHAIPLVSRIGRPIASLFSRHFAKTTLRIERFNFPLNALTKTLTPAQTDATSAVNPSKWIEAYFIFCIEFDLLVNQGSELRF
jgi:hypothetical protein